MRPALKERQRIASACPGYLTVVVECWDEPWYSESFAAKISFGPIPQLFQSWMFSCTDPGFRSALPWAEFLLRLRRVKIPLALCSSRPPDFSTQTHAKQVRDATSLTSARMLSFRDAILAAYRATHTSPRFNSSATHHPRLIGWYAHGNGRTDRLSE
jgi:hypothetical protein